MKVWVLTIQGILLYCVVHICMTYLKQEPYGLFMAGMLVVQLLNQIPGMVESVNEALSD